MTPKRDGVLDRVGRGGGTHPTVGFGADSKGNQRDSTGQLESLRLEFESTEGAGVETCTELVEISSSAAASVMIDN